MSGNDAYDTAQTLQDLDGEDWGEPGFPSHLVRESHRLHRVPLREFHTEDLRIMIGQQLDLIYLLPLAIQVLQVDPLSAGDLSPGDLLRSVLRIDPLFWQQHPRFRQQVVTILQQQLELPGELADAAADFMRG